MGSKEAVHEPRMSLNKSQKKMTGSKEAVYESKVSLNRESVNAQVDVPEDEASLLFGSACD